LSEVAFSEDRRYLCLSETMSNQSIGHIITATISSLRHLQCDEIWQITRVNNDIRGTIWVPELAPSQALFKLHQSEWKEQPPETWWLAYEKKFNDELKTDEKLGALRRLWHAIEVGKTIALVCFCSDPCYCHRRLVGIFLQQHGMTVEEFDKNTINDGAPQQLALF